MNPAKWTKRSLAAALGLAGLLGAFSLVTGQDLPGAREIVRPTSKLSGRVKEWTKNRHDDVDGLQLEDGSKVHFPPHQSADVARLAQPGDEVEVTGRRETQPRGETVFEATQITRGGETIKIDAPPRPRGPLARFGREEPMTANGVIVEFVANPHGDVDGFLLKDGTEVKLPPHQGDALQKFAQAGEEVRVEGRRHVTPRGDVHLHADRIVAASGQTLERDEPAGPPVPPHFRHAAPPRGREAGPLPHEEILKELRELRRLIEAQAAAK